MLQCISPHLTIDREAFEQHIAQYKRWLFRIRYACTYHHLTLAEKAFSYVPIIPFINPGPEEFAAPVRDPPHTHENFDFSWGTGPLVDSFGGLYYLNGTHTRVPGHEAVEQYDEATKEQKWNPLTSDVKSGTGPSNEYIHPICYHRSLVHGWEQHSALKQGWNRGNWQSKDGKKRYWWYKDNEKEKEKCALPEWAILPDLSNMEYNFERKWYGECEKSEKTRVALEKVAEFKNNDFLKTLDKNIEFGFDNKPQNLWP